MDQCATTALAEKLSALMTRECREGQAKRGNRAFERVLGRVPDAEPEPHDRR